MSRILNLIVVILEIVAFIKLHRSKSIKKSFVYYTWISNALTLCSSLMLVVLGKRPFVEVLRLTSASMLALTLFASVCILVPLTRNVKETLFSGSGLFHHLIIPVLSVVSYIFTEDKVPTLWVILPVSLTLIYGIIILCLNLRGKLDGPYPFFRVKKIGTRMTALWMGVLILAMSVFSMGIGYKKPAKTDVKYLFVHGLAGWGSYDLINDIFPYWGLSGGSIIRYLNNQGYESYAASVDPTESAWDRACELYAQLTGTRVDYGKAHSEAAGHERYGRDFTGRALMKDFDSSKVALIGHSFGGATVRLFSEILRNGSEEERAATDESDLSPFFKGGNGDNLFALVTLTAPTNGTTAYDLYEDESFDLDSISIPEEYERYSDTVSKGTKPDYDGREDWDYASFDMHIDNAFELNKRITTFDDVYYFAYPCSTSVVNADGSLDPDPSITEDIFMKGAVYMSKYTGYTKGGIKLDESWRSNDGLVNEISAGAPFGAPQESYSEGSAIEPGRWYVMPTFTGDHMSFQGGLTKKTEIKPFYLELVKLLAGLKKAE